MFRICPCFGDFGEIPSLGARPARTSSTLPSAAMPERLATGAMHATGRHRAAPVADNVRKLSPHAPGGRPGAAGHGWPLALTSTAGLGKGPAEFKSSTETGKGNVRATRSGQRSPAKPRLCGHKRLPRASRRLGAAGSQERSPPETCGHSSGSETDRCRRRRGNRCRRSRARRWHMRGRVRRRAGRKLHTFTIAIPILTAKKEGRKTALRSR